MGNGCFVQREGKMIICAPLETPQAQEVPALFKIYLCSLRQVISVWAWESFSVYPSHKCCIFLEEYNHSEQASNGVQQSRWCWAAQIEKVVVLSIKAWYYWVCLMLTRKYLLVCPLFNRTLHVLLSSELSFSITLWKRGNHAKYFRIYSAIEILGPFGGI